MRWLWRDVYTSRPLTSAPCLLVHCLPPQPCPPECWTASVEGLHSQWTFEGPSYSGNGRHMSLSILLRSFGTLYKASKSRVCVSQSEAARFAITGCWKTLELGGKRHTWRTREEDTWVPTKPRSSLARPSRRVNGSITMGMSTGMNLSGIR